MKLTSTNVFKLDILRNHFEGNEKLAFKTLEMSESITDSLDKDIDKIKELRKLFKEPPITNELLTRLTIKQLKQRCRDYKILGFSKCKNKKELIDKIIKDEKSSLSNQVKKILKQYNKRPNIKNSLLNIWNL